jgi:hypothetical protein
MPNLWHRLESAQNFQVNEETDASKQTITKFHCSVVQIGAFLAAEFEPIINLMEHKKMSLTENFSNDDKDDLIT